MVAVVSALCVLTRLVGVARPTSTVAVVVGDVVGHAEDAGEEVDHDALDPARDRLLVRADVMQLEHDHRQHDRQ